MVEKCRYVSKNLSKSVPHETSSGNIEIIAAVGKAPGGIDYTISGFLNRIVVEQAKRKKAGNLVRQPAKEARLRCTKVW